MKFHWLIWVAAIAGSAGALEAHPHTVPPPLNVSINIVDDSYKVAVTIEKQLWRTVAPVPADGTLWDPQRFERWFSSVCEIRAGDEVLRLEGRSMKALLMIMNQIDGTPAPPSGIAILRQPRSGALPRTLSVHWKNFDHILWEEEIQVPAEIRRGMESEAALLTPEEPELLWHTTELMPRARPELAPVAKPTPRDPGWTLPIYSIAVLLVSLALFAFLQKLPGAMRALLFLAGAGAAVALYSVGGIQIGADPEPEPLSAADAEAIFEHLHQNIYTAFEVDDEDEIFDRLSISADGPVLDKLYAEVYQSLILRDENGAVANVESVETTSRKVTFPAGRPSHFDVVWGWNMVGKVTHWGHTHRRKNVYEAEYTVRKNGDVWHIIDMNVLEHARVNLDPEPKVQEPALEPAYPDPRPDAGDDR